LIVFLVAFKALGDTKTFMSQGYWSKLRATPRRLPAACGTTN
jgi:hypothetical protein